MTHTAARSASALLLMAGLACEIPTAPPRFLPTFVVDVQSVSLPVTATPASTFITRDLADLDREVVARSRGGALVLRIDNPAGAAGTLSLGIEGGGEVVQSTIDVSEPSVRIPLGEAALRAFLSSVVMLRAAGTLCPSDGCVQRPPPFPEVVLRPRLEIVMEIGGV